MLQHEEDFINEQVAAQQRDIAEVETFDLLTTEEEAAAGVPIRGKSMRDVQLALVAAARCTVCGKTRVVLNLSAWRRPMQFEQVRPETHCACAPRVDADGSRHRAGPAWELVSVECEHCDHGEIVEMFDGYPERSICGFCEGLGRVPKADASGYMVGPFARPEERAS